MFPARRSTGGKTRNQVAHAIKVKETKKHCIPRKEQNDATPFHFPGVLLPQLRTNNICSIARVSAAGAFPVEVSSQTKSQS